jgi:hypothetical protein
VSLRPCWWGLNGMSHNTRTPASPGPGRRPSRLRCRQSQAPLDLLASHHSRALPDQTSPIGGPSGQPGQAPGERLRHMRRQIRRDHDRLRGNATVLGLGSRRPAATAGCSRWRSARSRTATSSSPALTTARFGSGTRSPATRSAPSWPSIGSRRAKWRSGGHRTVTSSSPVPFTARYSSKRTARHLSISDGLPQPRWPRGTFLGADHGFATELVDRDAAA